MTGDGEEQPSKLGVLAARKSSAESAESADSAERRTESALMRASLSFPPFALSSSKRSSVRGAREPFDWAQGERNEEGEENGKARARRVRGINESDSALRRFAILSTNSI